MLEGLGCNWKQSIGYFLTSSTVIVVFRPKTAIIVEEENILTYIEGYISLKIIKTVCIKYAAGLVGVLNKTTLPV